MEVISEEDKQFLLENVDLFGIAYKKITYFFMPPKIGLYCTDCDDIQKAIKAIRKYKPKRKKEE